MTSARDEIFGYIRSALGREQLDESIRTELERRLDTPPSHPRPVLDGDPIALFEARLKAVQGGFRRVSEEGVIDAIVTCLDHHGLGRSLIAAPALRQPPWSLSWPEDWNLTFGASSGEDRVSITPCFAAVAETGSVVLLSSPESPTSLNFLPDCHIVLVRSDQLLANIEDVWTRVREAGAPPRTVNFITGPSKTADVEQTIQYGAHGPRNLEVIFVSG